MRVFQEVGLEWGDFVGGKSCSEMGPLTNNKKDPTLAGSSWCDGDRVEQADVGLSTCGKAEEACQEYFYKLHGYGGQLHCWEWLLSWLALKLCGEDQQVPDACTEAGGVGGLGGQAPWAFVSLPFFQKYSSFCRESEMLETKVSKQKKENL